MNENHILYPGRRFGGLCWEGNEVTEAAHILRVSRAQLYNRIQDGSLKPQKDGARTYITRVELERYVQACGV